MASGLQIPNSRVITNDKFFIWRFKHLKQFFQTLNTIFFRRCWSFRPTATKFQLCRKLLVAHGYRVLLVENTNG
jgi:hypothetical protein